MARHILEGYRVVEWMDTLVRLSMSRTRKDERMELQMKTPCGSIGLVLFRVGSFQFCHTKSTPSQSSYSFCPCAPSPPHFT